MILGFIAGLLLCVLFSILLGAWCFGQVIRPYGTTWVLFGAGGALIGHLLA